MRTFSEYQNGELIASGQFDIDWDKLRSIRDAALELSDWRAVKDRVLPTAWKEYRQALRDLPQDYDTANDAADSFPEAPEDA